MLDLFERHEVESLATQFKKVTPFNYVSINGFLPELLAEEILAVFPDFRDMDEATFQRYERKIALRPDTPGCPEFAMSLLYALNSHEMINFLETVTAVDGLLPDPHFHGAGLQQTKSGGKLGVHVDFNRHEKLKLDRRLNVLIYLNKGWQNEWGGHLELWNADMTEAVEKILSVFNRCVIFATSDISYHGVPDPIRCPDRESRKQINLYYYSNGRDDRASGIAPHWTKHRRRPASWHDNVLRPMEKLYLALMPPLLVSAMHKAQNVFRKIKKL